MKRNLFLICCALTACVLLLAGRATPQTTEPPITETSEPETAGTHERTSGIRSTSRN